MLILSLIALPLLFGSLSFLIRKNRIRRCVLVGTAAVHLGLTLSLWFWEPSPVWQGWLACDALGLIFLTIVSVLFFAAAIYCLGYLNLEEKTGGHIDETGFVFTNTREAIFTGCLLLFLATMTLVTLSQHFGLIWVGIEATTLASAPLIYFHQHHRSLEATWKYLLICSVGIALALLGNFLISVATAEHKESISLLLSSLVAQAPLLSDAWLKSAVLLLFVGYGTKMGLAPMHTWLPDAHSEAPSVVSALLSGALLNCAFLGILRMHQVCVAAGQGQFSRDIFLLFGLLSITLAAVFIIRQADFKRMLAYSSVEHMGILAFGIGVGGVGVFGSLFHAINHSLTKAALFFLAGNILAVYKTKSTEKICGIIHVLPATGVLWLLGFFAITGSPPFATFMSKFIIVKSAIDNGHAVLGCLFLGLIATLFVAMSALTLKMTFGNPAQELMQVAKPRGLQFLMPSVVLLAILFLLGLYLPSSLTNVLTQAAFVLGGGAP